MTFKEELYAYCHQVVDERIALTKRLIQEAQQAANQDSKSSMGDKYETSREMMALEMRKAGEQLGEAGKLKQVLSELTFEQSSEKIRLGSLVSTSIGEFYLSVSLGKLTLKEREVFVLSVVSPLGKELLEKKSGDSFSFNKRLIEIRSVE